MERSVMTANSHLSDNEFAELLAGNTSQTALAHLQACADCSVEARDLREAINNFREVLHRAADLPAGPALAKQEARQPRWLHTWGLRSAGALAILLLVSGGMMLDRNVPPAPAKNSPQVSDAELLSQVQDELASEAPAALEPASYIAAYMGEDGHELPQSTTQQVQKARRQ